MGIEELLLARAKHEGLKEGEKKVLAEKKQIAHILKQNGIDWNIIAKSTKLPLSLIQSL
ncbi:hypothetical protein [Pedobacter sp.]|jgi:hypothetical protein|uniref:hypothetical protein n=1 Tax=Pedobacter sp. TaxID=1411316 RepID=UPI002C822596|nr:hypothetical protein [Pedobacter sp.]HWW42440.1 hypothetical protein [Pedobacter sp.]